MYLHCRNNLQLSPSRVDIFRSDLIKEVSSFQGVLKREASIVVIVHKPTPMFKCYVIITHTYNCLLFNLRSARAAKEAKDNQILPALVSQLLTN